MKLVLDFLFKNAFMKASYIVVGGSLIVNVLNYIFTLIMGRMLGPIGFGEMSSIFSLLLIIGVPSATLSLFVAKCVSDHRAREEHHLVVSFLKSLFRFVTITSIISFLVCLLLIPFFASFLGIHKIPLLIFAFLVPLGFFSSLTSGVMHGLQKFFNISAFSVISTTLKLLLGVLLVYIGYYVSGAVLAVVLASSLGYLYSWNIIKKELKDSRYITEIKTKISIRDYLPLLKLAFFANLIVALLMNIDIILAKHFFTPLVAGHYSALSTIGKIIIYATASFATVMFPMVSASHSKGDNQHKRILALSLSIISILSIIAVVCFFTFPGFIVKVLFGSAYADIVPYLGYFGLIALFYSISTALINYFVAIHDRLFFYISALLLTLQTVFLVLYHDSIAQFATILLIFSVLITLSLSVNLFLKSKKNPKETVIIQ